MYSEAPQNDGDGDDAPRGFGMSYGILDGRRVVVVDDVHVWGRWFETADRHVALTNINSAVRVSTVFLGLDHSYRGRSLWFETMVFRGTDGDDFSQERYTTWAEAETGHARVLETERAARWGFVRVIPYNDPTRMVLREARIYGVDEEDGRVRTSEGWFAPGDVYRNRRRVPWRPRA